MSITLQMPARDRINLAIKSVSIAVRRGVEASIVSMSRHAIREHVSGKFAPYWKYRTRYLRKSIGRSVRRWPVLSSETLVSGAIGFTGSFAQALEAGGTYRQQVKAHQRRRPAKMTAKQFAAMMARNGGRRRPAGSGPVRVRTHQRTRKESARYIVAATVAEFHLLIILFEALIVL